MSGNLALFLKAALGWPEAALKLNLEVREEEL
jgi:hypothetical protein